MRSLLLTEWENELIRLLFDGERSGGVIRAGREVANIASFRHEGGGGQRWLSYAYADTPSQQDADVAFGSYDDLEVTFDSMPTPFTVIGYIENDRLESIELLSLDPESNWVEPARIVRHRYSGDLDAGFSPGLRRTPK